VDFSPYQFQLAAARELAVAAMASQLVELGVRVRFFVGRRWRFHDGGRRE